MRALLFLFLPVLLIAAWILSSLRAAEPGTADAAPHAPARIEIRDPAEATTPARGPQAAYSQLGVGAVKITPLLVTEVDEAPAAAATAAESRALLACRRPRHRERVRAEEPARAHPGLFGSNGVENVAANHDGPRPLRVREPARRLERRARASARARARGRRRRRIRAGRARGRRRHGGRVQGHAGRVLRSPARRPGRLADRARATQLGARDPARRDDGALVGRVVRRGDPACRGSGLVDRIGKAYEDWSKKYSSFACDPSTGRFCIRLGPGSTAWT